MTAAALLAEATARLQQAGITAAEWDAERLLRHVLGWDRAALVARPEAQLRPALEARFRSLVARRASREPLQHLVGTQAFWKHEFVVGRDVLVPRPETELLVELALERLRDVAAPLLVDVGTGSGCVALSLADERRDAEVHAVDVSEPALAVARENARRLGLEERVRFHLGDLLEPVAALAGRVDLVVSNPPYVAAEQRDALPPEVRDHEPAVALFAPEHGIGVHRRLAVAAAATLRAGGALVVEIGAGQRAAVEGACRAAGLEMAAVRDDLQSIPRALVATKRAQP